MFCRECGGENPADSKFCESCGTPFSNTSSPGSSPGRGVEGGGVVALRKGAVIGGTYEIQEVLGDGGMGTVYRATHARLGHDVAVKVLASNLARDPSIIARFEQEAQLQANLKHPGIVAVHDFISDGEVSAFVMEYVEGRTLEDVIRRETGPIPFDRCMEIFLPLLGAMAFAHERGVVHRDIKPSNIMLSTAGDSEVLKVMDFGIAKALGGAQRTATGTKMGTIYYMSPEQCKGRTDIDRRADIYSLGITLFEMATGRVPFDHESEYDLMTAHLQEPPPSPSSIYPGVTPEFEAVILCSVAKDRDKRYQSAEEFRQALEGMRHQVDLHQGAAEALLESSAVPKLPLAPVPVAPRVVEEAPAKPASLKVRLPLSSGFPSSPPVRPSGQPMKDEFGTTMLGVPAAPGRRRSSAPLPQAFDSGATPDFDGAIAPSDDVSASDWDVSLDEAAPKRRGYLMVAVILVAVSATAVVAAYVFFLKESYQITSDVSPGGEIVLVRLAVAPAPSKAKVRFAGQERDLINGTAEFEIPWNDVSLGANQLFAEIVEAGGAASRHKISFFLAVRAMADLGGLKAAEPFYSVHFQVAKGATLKVAGQPAKTDGAGGYLHKIPLADALAGSMDEGETVVHRLPFHVRLPNQPTVIEYVDTAIPRTPLTVTSPLPGIVVDQESLPCSGVTTPGARVTVNEVIVPAPTGRFASVVSLPNPGAHPVVVVATAPGKAPRTLRLEVRRVQSMAPMIAEFARTVDPRLTYSTLGRDPDALRGRSVRFRGRIINITPPSRGRTLMQILVGEGCPPEARCLLHVVFNGTTAAGLSSHVTVYATVLGRWQGQNERGDTLTAPSVQARFLVLDSSRR